MAVIFEKHIPLGIGTSIGLLTVSTTSASYVESALPTYSVIDTSQYTGGTYYYEATLKTSAATAYATLWDVTGAAAVAGAEVTTTSTSSTRVRSSAISPTSGNTFSDRIKNDGTNTTTFYGGRVVVVQNAASITNTESQISLFAYNDQTTTSATYVDFTTILDTWFLYTAANWDGTVNIYFEVTGKVNASTGYYTLTDTSNNTVSGAEVTTTSTSVVRIRSGAVTLVDGTVYKGRYHNDGSNTSHIFSAKLVIQQSGSPTKSESHVIAGLTADGNGGAASFEDNFGRAYYDPANWSLATISWYGDYSYFSTSNSCQIDLYALTDAAEITNSLLTTTGDSTKRRGRTSALTMPGSAQNITWRDNHALATNYTGYGRALAVMTWTSGGGTASRRSLLGVGL